jgi:hypothetical protein
MTEKIIIPSREEQARNHKDLNDRNEKVRQYMLEHPEIMTDITKINEDHETLYNIFRDDDDDDRWFQFMTVFKEIMASKFNLPIINDINIYHYGTLTYRLYVSNVVGAILINHGDFNDYADYLKMRSVCIDILNKYTFNHIWMDDLDIEPEEGDDEQYKLKQLYHGYTIKYVYEEFDRYVQCKILQQQLI